MTPPKSLIEKLLAANGDSPDILKETAISIIRAHFADPEVVGRIKAMAIAHSMSHEPFCDAMYWKDEFEQEYRVAIKALTGE